MNQNLLEAIISIGMLFGIFGNLNVIVASSRKHTLRTKGDLFIMILAVTHLVCNVSELIGLAFHFRFRKMPRRTCFKYNIVYSFAVMFQSALFFILALDLCFSIVLPIKHMIWKKQKYVAVMCLFPVLYAVVTTVITFIFIPDEETPYCIFMLISNPRIYQVVSTSLVFLNVLTLLVIIHSVLCAVRKSIKMRGSRHSTGSRSSSIREENGKLLRSTFFLVLFYIASWWSVVITYRVLVELNPTDAMCYMPYVTIMVMPNFCQAYYVTYFRSIRFRRAFNEQLHWLSCGRIFPNVFQNQNNIRTPSGSRQGNSSNSAKQSTLPSSQDRKVRESSQSLIRFSVPLHEWKIGQCSGKRRCKVQFVRV